MLRMLSRNSRLGRTEKNKRDKFNTHHLAQLFNDKSQDVRFFNLLTTRRILCRFLRSNVKDSYQIKESSKLVYLNTLKCTALRCCNSKLAVRLQMTSWYLQTFSFIEACIYSIEILINEIIFPVSSANTQALYPHRITKKSPTCAGSRRILNCNQQRSHSEDEYGNSSKPKRRDTQRKIYIPSDETNRCRNQWASQL